MCAQAQIYWPMSPSLPLFPARPPPLQPSTPLTSDLSPTSLLWSFSVPTQFSPSILNLFIYLFLAVLGLRFCARALSSCGEWGPLFITVRGPLTIAASLVAEHRLQTRRLSSCGSRA